MAKCAHVRWIDLKPSKAFVGADDIVPELTVMEEDGDPTVLHVREIRVTNGTLTDNGDGSVSIAIGTGGGGSHLGYMSIPLPATINFPGPCNITGDDMTITSMIIASDGTVQGNIAGQSFSLANNDTGVLTVSISWAAGTWLSYSITSYTSGNYVVASFLAE